MGVKDYENLHESLALLKILAMGKKKHRGRQRESGQSGIRPPSRQARAHALTA